MMQPLPETTSAMFRTVQGNRAWVRALDLALVLLIALNVLAVTLESIDELAARYGTWFTMFEWLSVAVFTIEYVARIWLAPRHPSGRFRGALRGRILFALTPMAIIDLAAIAPAYLVSFTSIDLRCLRVLRLVRIFKLTRYSAAMTILLGVLRDELPSFGAALFVLFMILMLAASGMYLVEHEAQPEAFGSIPSAMWWAVATLTTVGYGDVTPITAAGKLFGSLITIVGIGMVALPAGILSSAFSDHLRRRREQYSEFVKTAIDDGELSMQERRELIELRRELGIDRDEAERLRDAVEERRPGAAAPDRCPHCGLDIGSSG